MTRSAMMRQTFTGSGGVYGSLQSDVRFALPRVSRRRLRSQIGAVMLRRLPESFVSEMAEFSELFERLDQLALESRGASQQRRQQIESEIDEIEDQLILAEQRFDDTASAPVPRRRTG